MAKYNLAVQMSLQHLKPKDVKAALGPLEKGLKNVSKVLSRSLIQDLQKDMDRLAKSVNKVTTAINNVSNKKLTKVSRSVRDFTASTKVAAKYQALLKQRQQAAAASANKLAKANKGLGQSFRAINWSLQFQAVAAFTNALSNSISSAIKFERTLNKIQQVNRDAVIDTDALSSSIVALGRNYGVTANEIAEANLKLAQSGIRGKQAQVVLEAITKTDLAPTFSDIGSTTEAVIAAMNQFNLTGREAAGTLEAINVLAGDYAVESSGLAGVISRAGAAFGAVGGELNELLGVFTVVKQTTRLADEKIGTGLRTIALRVQRQSSVDLLKTLGIDAVDQATGRLRNITDILRELSEVVGKLPKGDLTLTRISEALAGTRQSDVLIPLLKQFGLVDEAIEKAAGSVGSLDQAAALAFNTLDNKIKKLNASFLDLGTKITGNSGPFNVAIDQATKLADILGGLATQLQEVSKSTLSTQFLEFGALAGGLAFSSAKGGGLALRGNGLLGEGGSLSKGAVGAGVGAAASIGISGLLQQGRTEQLEKQRQELIKQGNFLRADEIQQSLELQNGLNATTTAISGLAGLIGGPLVGALTALALQPITSSGIGQQNLENYRFAVEPFVDVGKELVNSISGIFGGERILDTSDDINLERKFLARLQEINFRDQQIVKERGDKLNAGDLAVGKVRLAQQTRQQINDKGLNNDPLSQSATEKEVFKLLADQEAAAVDALKDFAKKLGEQEAKLGKFDFQVFLDLLGKDGLAGEINRIGTAEFEAAFKEAGENIKSAALDSVKQSFDRLAAATQRLNDATLSRLDVEREAEEILARAGGGNSIDPAVGIALAVQRANVGVKQDGNKIKDGSVDEFKNRFTALQEKITELTGREDEASKEELTTLNEISKNSLDALRELIGVQSQQLDIAKSVQRQAESERESEIMGNIDAIFARQGREGAMAAIALGNQQLAGAYGQGAIGEAVKFMQQQRDMGVTEMYGQQLSGKDGLIQRGANMGYRNLGLDPSMGAGFAENLAVEAAAADLTGAAEVLRQAGAMQQQAAMAGVGRANEGLGGAQDRAILLKIDPKDFPQAEGFAQGGHIFKKMGTDTVPAMLTPGEFVVRKEVVSRGNNLSMLSALNRGQSPTANVRGGTVYASGGGQVPSGGGGNLPSITLNAESFGRYVTKFNEAVQTLANTSVQHTLAPVNVNVNLTGSSALAQMGENIRSAVMQEVTAKLSTLSVTQEGGVDANPSNLPSFT